MNIPVKILDLMMIDMADGARGADITAAQTGDTVADLGHHCLAGLLIKGETVRRAYI